MFFSKSDFCLKVYQTSDFLFFKNITTKVLSCGIQTFGGFRLFYKHFANTIKVCLLSKCQSIVFHAATTNRSNISTDDSLHQGIATRISNSSNISQKWGCGCVSGWVGVDVFPWTWAHPPVDSHLPHPHPYPLTYTNSNSMGNDSLKIMNLWMSNWKKKRFSNN